MTTSTANPKAARDHARAMAGTKADAMPVLPPVADDAGGELVWEETVAPVGYASHRIARGTRLRLIDLQGDACASMLLFNAECPVERLNVADTMKVQWNAYLGAGQLILSDMGRVMMSVLEDDAETHDLLCGASSEASNARIYGDGKNYGAHPNARDRFMLAVAKYGLGRKDVHPCVNWFKGVRVEEGGGTVPIIGPFAPGRSLLLRAEMDLIVVAANCPHVLDERAEFTATPLRITAWKGAVTPEKDPIRKAAPEGLRAFLNTEDYYRR